MMNIFNIRKEEQPERENYEKIDKLVFAILEAIVAQSQNELFIEQTFREKTVFGSLKQLIDLNCGRKSESNIDKNQQSYIILDDNGNINLKIILPIILLYMSVFRTRK